MRYLIVVAGLLGACGQGSVGAPVAERDARGDATLGATN
jgi:hypothetical protein